ncbi:hypothetical protein FA10DRAFT_269074 [Acaromyces ingoldii]|uniref:Uncharacterized protein n=1 Tax=Acaromyces ingoldii TaxID=215250 RepID=A0A316YF10_9BASI|nr:hypothetical protein FA10DRAFT_269074 [Acaromyces ingoldii]PWN87782.1 hypothetical protein FA10DRAFT_269074 [Acaromyces ingoldii]
MRIARSLFTLAVIGVISSVVIAVKKDRWDPLTDKDQASTSRLEVDGEERHETLGTVNFIQSRNNPVAWLKALLSKVVYYERHLKMISSRASREDERLEKIIVKQPWSQHLIRKQLEVHNKNEVAKRRLKKIPKEKKMIKNLLKDVKAALPVARRRRARTRTRRRQR